MSTKNILLGIFTIDLLAIAIALNIGSTPDEYFGDGGLITFLSFAQLLFLAAICWDIFRNRKGKKQFNYSNPICVWLYLALGYIYLAVDEVLGIHMAIFDFISNLLNEAGWMLHLHNFSVIFYALIGLLILYTFRGEIVKYEDAAALMTVGFLLLIFMVIINLTNRIAFVDSIIPDHQSAEIMLGYINVLVGALKIFTEAVFVGVLTTCNEVAAKV